MSTNVSNLEDHCPFDAGTPTRCWHCGGSDHIHKEVDEGGFAWTCSTCPHPGWHIKTPECPTASCPRVEPAP